VDFVFAEPFRAFRMYLISGRAFEVAHPEKVKVGLSSVTVYSRREGGSNSADRWQEMSLMLLDSIEALEMPAPRRAFSHNSNVCKAEDVGATAMMTPQTVLTYVKAEPFRPFRLHTASGRTFDIRHPEMIKVLKSSVLVFKSSRQNSELPDEFESVSLMLTESVSHLETPAR
jgi:hypothetical protein